MIMESKLSGWSHAGAMERYFQKRQRNIKKMSIEFVHHLISYSRMGGTICWVQIWKRKDAQICNTNYIE